MLNYKVMLTVFTGFQAKIKYTAVTHVLDEGLLIVSVVSQVDFGSFDSLHYFAFVEIVEDELWNFLGKLEQYDEHVVLILSISILIEPPDYLRILELGHATGLFMHSSDLRCSVYVFDLERQEVAHVKMRSSICAKWLVHIACVVLFEIEYTYAPVFNIIVVEQENFVLRSFEKRLSAAYCCWFLVLYCSIWEFNGSCHWARNVEVPVARKQRTFFLCFPEANDCHFKVSLNFCHFIRWIIYYGPFFLDGNRVWVRLHPDSFLDIALKVWLYALQLILLISNMVITVHFFKFCSLALCSVHFLCHLI